MTVVRIMDTITKPVGRHSNNFEKPARQKSPLFTVRNAISGLAAALCAAALQIGPAKAWILGGGNPYDIKVTGFPATLGDCAVGLEAQGVAVVAYIVLDNVAGQPVTGGTIWVGNGGPVVRPAFTGSDLETECDLSNVVISSNIGATGATYADETLMELVLTGTQNSDGITYDWVYRMSGNAGAVPVLFQSKVTAVSGASADETQGQIADSSRSRGNNILNTTPDVIDFLDGGGSTATRNFNLNASDGNFNLAFDGSLRSRSSQNFAGGYDVWARVLAVHSDSVTSSSDFFIGYLGAHQFINENFLIGAMIQGDYGSASNSAVGSSASGRGFMLGPYMAGRIANSNLRFEGQARWGQSFNNISPTGAYTDNYSTERWTVMGKLEGNYSRGIWTITPNVSLAYFSETQAAYVDSFAVAIPAQTTTLGEFNLGPEFSRDYMLTNGNTLRGIFGMSAVTNFDVSSTSGSQAFPLGNGTVRGRVDLGFTTTTGNGWALSASGFYDGIGINNYQSYGGSLTADIRF